MSKPDNFYNEVPLKRPLEEIHDLCRKTKGKNLIIYNYCCENKPLFNIPLDHIILEELHLMLHITDVLIANIIEDAI